MTNKDQSPNCNANLNRQRAEWEGTTARISPPPIRREQLITPKEYHAPTGRLTTAGSSTRSDACIDETRRRHSHYTKPPGESSRDQLRPPPPVSEYSSHSFSFSTSLRQQKYGSRCCNAIWRKSSVARANSHSNTGIRSLSKPVCLICSKSTNTKYDQIIACPSCYQYYHDSCRTPPLIDGVDPQRWKCIKCCNGKTRRILSIPSAPLASFSDQSASSTKQPSLTAGPRAETVTNWSPPALGTVKSTENTVSRRYAPLFLDGSDSPLRPNYASKLKRKESSLPITKNASLYQYPNTTDAHREVAGPSKYRQNPLIFEHGTQTTEGIELSNTSTQHSSWLNRSSFMSNPPCHTTDEGLERNNNSMLFSFNQSRDNISATVLCSKCDEQLIFTKRATAGMICRSCQKWLLTIDSEKLEIPETPAIVSSMKSQEQPKSSKLASGTMRAVLSHLEGRTPSPWFHPRFMASTPKTRQKDDGPVKRDETPESPVITLHQQPLHCPDTFSYQSANGRTQIYLPRLNQPRLSTENNTVITFGCAIDKATPVSSMRSPSVNSHEPDNDHHRSPSSPRDVEGAEPFVSKSPTITLNSMLDIVPQLRVNMERPPESELEHLPSSVSRSLTGVRNARLLPDNRASPYNDTPLLQALPSNRSHTHRQFARKALVVANGQNMTTSQILPGIADSFSYMRVREGAWGTGISSTLSEFPKFTGTKATGDERGKKVYGFTSANFQAQYDEEYPECRVASHPQSETTTIRATPRISTSPADRVLPNIRRAKKSAPTLPMSISIRQPQSSVTAEPPRPKAPAMQRDSEDLALNPFERRKLRQPLKTIDSDFEVGRYAKLRDVSVRPQQLSIEIMTEAEKVHKIAEIKARPSRKKYFGSDHRLAHKRRYGLKDIHEERDSAWKSEDSKPCESQSDVSQYMDIDDDENQKIGRTLSEAFDLPINMIPMNDGFTELAFRDGTLVNGRLPRPRNVYKVGKLFGGDLTVRTT